MLIRIFDHHEYDKKPSLILSYTPDKDHFKVLEVGNYLIINGVKYEIEMIVYDYDRDRLSVFCKNWGSDQFD